jgi:glyceraldehyde-3-phosphate dehydrogenase (NADP+)
LEDDDVKNFIAGKWVDKSKKIEVRNPFDNSVIDTVPKADAGDLESALVFAERGAKVMAKLSSYERWKILRKAADLMAARNEELGQVISKEGRSSPKDGARRAGPWKP